MYRVLILGILIAVGTVSLYLWENVQATTLGYDVSSVRRECEKWEQVNRDLRLRINRLISLDRLDRVAQERHLIAPSADRVVYLND